MIYTSDRWRFIQALEDKGFFSEEIVQHTLVDHRAVRRIFSEKFSADPAASEQALNQAKLAAKCNPPALPLIYQIEMLNNQLTVLYEVVEGRPLEDLINSHACESMSDWSKYALMVLNEAAEMRRAGAHFEKLDFAHLVLADGDDLRLTQRSPIGNVPRERVGASQALQRMTLQERIGVYSSPNPPDERGEMNVLKEILLKMAAGSSKMTFQEFLTNVQSLQYGTEGKISHVLLMMHGAGGQPPSLDQVRVRVQDMFRQESDRFLRKLRDFTPDKPSRPDHEQRPPSTPTPQPERPISSVHRTPTPIPSTSDSSDDSNPYGSFLPDLSAAPPPPAVKKPPAVMPEAPLRAQSQFGETLNPWANATGGVGPVVASDVPSASSPAPISTPRAPVMIKVKKDVGLGSKIFKIVLLLIAVLVIGAAVYFAVDVIRAGGGTTAPPVALIQPLERQQVALNERVTLDASTSYDPDGEEFSYYWTVVTPEASVIFSDVGSSRSVERRLYITRSPKVTARFFTAGETELELKVHDGKRFSDSTNIIISVRPEMR